jgi:hypothetical protein
MTILAASASHHYNHKERIMSATTELSPTAVTPKRRTAFYITWGLSIILIVGLFGLASPLMGYFFVGLFDPEALGVHLYHNFLASALLWVLVVAMIVQVRRPEAHAGSMLQTIGIWLMLCLAAVLSAFPIPPLFIFLVLALIVAALHPARAELLSWRGFREPVLAGLTAVAAVPLLLYTVDQIGLQLSTSPHDPHTEFGHWMLMGAYALTIIFLGLVSATRPSGWRTPAWTAGLLAVLMGLVAVLNPHQPSSVGVVWGLVAIIWGAVFIAAAEWLGRGASQ